MTLAISTQAQLPGENALVLMPEANYVTETETGLAFRGDTPIEVWGCLTERLITAHRRLEFAIADAINFGEQAYGEQYAQWVEETGLAKRTLQNMARIGRLVEPARRRAAVSFSHHAEVAALDPDEQEQLLDLAEEQGLTRYGLRDAVRAHRHSLRSQEPTDAPWSPQIDDLVPEARKALSKALRATSGDDEAFTRGWLEALRWTGACTAFGDAWRES